MSLLRNNVNHQEVDIIDKIKRSMTSGYYAHNFNSNKTNKNGEKVKNLE